MRTGLVLAVLAASVVACVPPKRVAPPPKPVAASARPFEAMPSVALVDHTQPGPLYRVQIAADITRDVMPTDDLAIVVSVGDLEVGRYPIVGKFERSPTRIKQEIELPLGDYEIDFAYQGQIYAGMPFRLAEVPVWGGRKALQLRPHQGTRVSLREKKLWVGRWWANDGPPRAWIIEWVHEGKVATMTSGRENIGIPAQASRIVGGAAGAFASTKVVQNTVWAYGEEYPLPDIVALTPGIWAARVVHAGSPPIAVVFNVRPGGRLAEADKRRVRSVGWEPSWSQRLEQRALAVTEVERLTAKLPHVNPSQPFDDVQDTGGPESPLRISTAAVRALFRSKELAEAWWQFETLNKQAAAAPVQATPAAYPAKGNKQTAMNAKRDAKQSAKDAAARKAKLRALRTEIEQLIKTHGGAWKPEEFPRS